MKIITKYRVKKTSNELANRIVGYKALKKHNAFMSIYDESSYIDNIIVWGTALFSYIDLLDKKDKGHYIDSFINFYIKQLRSIGLSISKDYRIYKRKSIE